MLLPRISVDVLMEWMGVCDNVPTFYHQTDTKTADMAISQESKSSIGSDECSDESGKDLRKRDSIDKLIASTELE